MHQVLYLILYRLPCFQNINSWFSEEEVRRIEKPESSRTQQVLKCRKRKQLWLHGSPSGFRLKQEGWNNWRSSSRTDDANWRQLSVLPHLESRLVTLSNCERHINQPSMTSSNVQGNEIRKVLIFFFISIQIKTKFCVIRVEVDRWSSDLNQELERKRFYQIGAGA